MKHISEHTSDIFKGNPADYEPVDDTPVTMPTRLRLPQSRTDQLRDFIRMELSRRAAEDGHDSFEEADDLEPIDEGELPYTPYELSELEPPAEQAAQAAQAPPGAAGAPTAPEQPKVPPVASGGAPDGP